MLSTVAYDGFRKITVCHFRLEKKAYYWFQTYQEAAVTDLRIGHGLGPLVFGAPRNSFL